MLIKNFQRMHLKYQMVLLSKVENLKKDFMGYSLFKKLVKEISKLPETKVFNYMKECIIPRLSIMGLLVKNKQSWKDCGIIFNKKAGKFDPEYIWGVRFYVLLINSFNMWNFMASDQNEDNFENLISQVPGIPEFDYFYQDPGQIEIANNELQILYEGEQDIFQQDNISQKNMPQSYNDQILGHDNNNRDVEEIQEECRKLQKGLDNYLKYLFRENIDGIRIKKHENIFRNTFSDKGFLIINKLQNIDFDNLNKQEFDKFQQISTEYSYQQQLYNHLVDQEYDYLLSQHKTRAQQEILEMLKIQNPQKDYSKYQKIVDKNQQKQEVLSYEDKKISRDISIDQNSYIKKYNYNYAQNLNELKDDKIKLPPKINIQMADSHYDSPELLEVQNQQLKDKKQRLAEEIKNLEKKERQLKRRSKTSSIINPARKNNPKVLIEQIQLKNREYESLKSKYNSMMHEISSRLQNDASQMHTQQHNLEQSIKDSRMNISRLRQQNQQRTSQMNFSYGKDSAYYNDYSQHNSRLLTPSIMQSNIKQSIYPEKQNFQSNKYYKQSNLSQSKYRY